MNKIQIFAVFLFLNISLFSQGDNKIERYPLMADMPVKNVILMIGDGMGISQVAAVRLQRFGNNRRLSMEKMPVAGIMNTHSANDIITDSASGATAMSTGYKTNNGMIGMMPDSLSVKTIMEAAKEKGMKTGMVSTSSITHATPASFMSHVDSRGKQYKIAEQLVEADIDVMFGGGMKFFSVIVDDSTGEESGTDLIPKAKANEFEVLLTKEDLYKSKSNKLLGLFSYRGLVRDTLEPTLGEMTNKALDVLSTDENGFFLLVEGSQIDWEAHDNNFKGVQRELLAFDIAINNAIKFAMKNPGTLVIVTADHETGGLVISGGTEKNVEVSWVTNYHSGTPVGIFAFGPHALKFTGVLDNTEIPRIIGQLLKLENFPQKIN